MLTPRLTTSSTAASALATSCSTYLRMLFQLFTLESVKLKHISDLKLKWFDVTGSHLISLLMLTGNL